MNKVSEIVVSALLIIMLFFCAAVILQAWFSQRDCIQRCGAQQTLQCTVNFPWPSVNKAWCVTDTGKAEPR